MAPRRSRTNDSDSDSDGLDDLQVVPTISSRPAASGEKRTHDQMTASHSNNGSTPVNANVINGVKNFAKRMKLSDEQLTDVEAFLNDSALAGQGREYVAILHVANEVKKIVKTQGQWEPSAPLKKNIKHYVDTASLSPHLRSFLSTQTVQAVAKKIVDLGLDLPDNIRQNQALLDVLTRTVADTFTQRRSTMKKAIKASLGYTPKGKNAKYVSYETDIECDTIYDLARALVKNTKCAVNATLCARAAILRRAFKKDPGDRFWEKVDKMLVNIRSRGDGDPQKIAGLVKDCLEKDRQKYGIDDYQIRDEEQSDAQTEIGQILEAQNIADDEQAEGDDPGPQQQESEERDGSERNASTRGSDGPPADVDSPGSLNNGSSD